MILIDLVTSSLSYRPYDCLIVAAPMLSAARVSLITNLASKLNVDPLVP